MTRAAIGLGANIGDASKTVARAVRSLARFGNVVAVSSLYRSEPWGVQDQPPFLNAVAVVQTTLAPRALLQRLQELERELGRVPTFRWGPRAVDLDILYYGDDVVDEPDLQIPHPRISERAFVLVPLAEVDSRYGEALAAMPDDGRRKVQPLLQGEWVALMSDEQLLQQPAAAGLINRVRALAAAFLETDLVRMRIEEPNEDAIELRRSIASSEEPREADESTRAEPTRGRIDPIKADLVGVIHLGRPAPTEGEVLTTDRELAYVDALGIRTGVRSLGPGRIVAVRIEEGQPVEYGQVLFEIDRG